MNFDDVVYVICLAACICAGSFVRKLRDESQRKLLCTVFGCVLVVVLSGFHSLHCLFSLILGAAGIIYVHPSKCHVATFAIMFGYLVLFRFAHIFGLPDPPGHTNMIQMILTLKVSGVAFEKTASWKKFQQREEELRSRSDKTDDPDKPLVEITDYDDEMLKIGFVDLFHYSFNYIGVLLGPYYRYRTYRDYFETPFKNFAPHDSATLDKLKNAVIVCCIYLSFNYVWPIEYALSDVFYTERSFVYRLLFVWPTFVIFRMRLFTGMTLGECVCTMAGFGAYPDEADVNNGEGPRKQYNHLKRDADKRSYNFTTIVNLRLKTFEQCWTFREGMKHWNICVQYWLAVNVYKLFPSKRFRTAATLLVSAYWHGFRPGHYFCIMGAPFYVPLEDMWHKLVRQDATGAKRRLIDIIFWIGKFFSASYFGTAFVLATFANIWKFYSSVYHIGYITWALMVALGMFLTKQRKAAERRKKHLVDRNAVGDSFEADKAKAE